MSERKDTLTTLFSKPMQRQSKKVLRRFTISTYSTPLLARGSRAGSSGGDSASRGDSDSCPRSHDSLGDGDGSSLLGVGDSDGLQYSLV